MTRKKTAALATVVAAMAASALILAFYVGATPDGDTPPVKPPDDNGPITPPADDKTKLTVLTSPATFPFAERWAAKYNNGDNLGTVQLVYSDDVNDSNIPLLYSNVSRFLADHSADIAITGRPVEPTGNFTYEGSVFLPTSPQGIAIVYNVPGFPDVSSGMKIDAPTLYAILTGNATRWNDPRITELNPNLNLPNEPIVVAHELKAGSATELLERYLNSSVPWPESSLAAESPATLSAMVRQTPFSVGYVDFSNAIQTRMTYAALQNSDGDYILPSSESIGKAIQNGTVIADPAIVDGRMQMPPITSVGQLGNGSYPVVGFYYVALADGRTGAGGSVKSAAALDFARWITGASGQRVLAEVQYPSIYEYNEMLKALTDGLAAEMQNARFENATNFTSNPNDSVYGQVAASGDSVYIVWEESVSGRNYDIFFKMSQNGGNSFQSTATNLSNNSGFSEHPQIAANGNNVYVVWADNTSGKKEVLFAKSTDGGNAFGKAITLSDTDASSYNTEIAVSGDNVYAVWQERKEASDAVVFRASTDGGNTFGDPVTIASSVDPEAFPKVSADRNAVHVVWASPDQPALHYVQSRDEGATFSPFRQLNGGEDVGEAQVAAYGDNIYVIWGGLASQPASQLFYIASTDRGAEFTEPASIGEALVNPMNVELTIMPGQNSDDHFIHIVAQVESSPDNEEILLTSTANGSAFIEPINLSNNEGISECPSIAVSGKNIFVVWEDRTAGNNEIFFAKGRVP